MKRHPTALINRRNWSDTRAYLTYRAEVLNAVDGSLRLYRTHLDHLLRWATDIPFARAADIRPVFPRYIADLKTSPTYQAKTLETARAFLEWARDRNPDTYPPKAYRETLRPVKTQPQAIETREYYTLEEMLILAAAPVTTLTEQRDRAAACLLFLSGARAAAFCTLPLRAVNLTLYELKQWPLWGVRTKNRKAGTTYLLQNEEVGPLLDIAREWDEIVRRTLPSSAPWYALIDRNTTAFAKSQVPGQSRTSNLAQHLNALCTRTGVKYKSPHKFRHGFAVYALSLCETMEDFKAVSQNLMHNSMSTTDAIYAKMVNDRVAARMAILGSRKKLREDPEILELFKEFFQRIER